MIKDGGPAFPTSGVFDGNRGEVNPVGAYFDAGGMTLRDYFAAKAMQGDWAAQSAQTGEFTNQMKDEWILDRAKFYYRYADAMLAARNEVATGTTK